MNGIKRSLAGTIHSIMKKTPTVRAWEQGHNVPSGAAARLIEALQIDPLLVKKLIA